MASTRFTSLLYTLPVILTTSLAAAQNGDGGAASGNLPPSAAGGDAAGAAGPSSGSFTLSTGATVAIAVVVSIVVVLGITTAVLFYFAKKRQWNMKEKIRASTRRVASGVKRVMSPITPSRPTFSPRLESGFPKSKKSTYREMRGPSPLRKGEKNGGIGFDVDMDSLNRNGRKERDLEKGEGTRVLLSEKQNGHKPNKPSITIPKTGKKVEEPPKTPMLSRFFGRD